MSLTSTAKKKKFLLPLLLAFVALAIIGFLVSRAGIDKLLVKQKLDDTIAAIREKGRSDGRDIDITYGDIEVAGGFTSKHVVIHDLAASMKPLQPEPKAPGDDHKVSALKISTPSVEIYPSSADLSSARVSLPQPITFTDLDAPDKLLLKIAAQTPIDVNFSRDTESGVAYTSINHTAPAAIDFTFLREKHADGAEDATPTITPVYDTLHVTFGAGSALSSRYANDESNLGKADITFKDIVVTPQSAPETAVKIATIDGHWSNIANEKKRNDVNANLKVGPITSDKADMPYLPVELGFEMAHTGSLPENAQTAASGEAESPTFTLKNVSFTTKEAGLTGSADFTASATEVLPIGKAEIHVKNLPFVLNELRTRKIMQADAEPWVNSVLEKVSGTPVASLTDLNVTIERPKGGAFKVGNTTFEELFAIVLQHMMQKKAGIPTPQQGGIAAPTSAAPVKGAAPTLPAADKLKATPIPVPDNGVRG